MKILKLKLRGAIGIRKGLGVEEIEQPFTKPSAETVQKFAGQKWFDELMKDLKDAPFNSGLIVFVGPNGAGKTTLAENMHFYRETVSHDGSLVDQFYLKDSYRIIYGEHNHNIYKSEILIDAFTGASKAYLFENNISLNDGLKGSYDAALEKIIGTSKLFFNSRFAGQKSKGIIGVDVTERRKLFNEMMDIDYEPYANYCKLKLSGDRKKRESLIKSKIGSDEAYQQTKGCLEELQRVEGETKALQQDQTSIEVLEEERKEKLNYQAQLISDMTELGTKIDSINEFVRKDEVQIQLAHQKVAANEQIQKELKEIETQIGLITKEYNSKITRYQGDVEDQKKLLERYKKLATPEAKEKIEAALKQKTELKDISAEDTAQLNEIRKKYSEHQKEYSEKLKEIGDQEKTVIRLRNDVYTTDIHILDITAKIERAAKDTEIIDKVPCDEATGSSCQFLINAYTSKHSISDAEKVREESRINLIVLKEELDKKETLFRTNKGIADEKFQLKDTDLRKLISETEKNLEEIQIKLKEMDKSNWEKLLDELKEADNQIKLCEQSIAGHDKLIAEAKLSFENNLSSLKTQSENLDKKFDETVEKRIAELETDLAYRKQQLSGLNVSLNSSRSRLDEAKQEVAKLEQLIETMTKNEERIEKLKNSKIEIESEIKDWNFLVKAFDKTGIPVLKFDAQSAEISMIVNDLLSFYDNSSRIKIITKELSKDKSKEMETLKIIAIDNHNIPGISQTMDIIDKSGGQKVWYTTALQGAISIFNNTSNTDGDTVFFDEQDGSLDGEGSTEKYFEMLNKVHIKNKAFQTILITHRREIIEMIPQQLRFRDGILEVVSQ